MPEFIEKWVEDTARQRIVREYGIIESEYPAKTSTEVSIGFCIPNSESCSLLVSVPSSRWYKPRGLWVHNRSAVRTEIFLYTGGSAAVATATIQGLYVGPRTTELIALDGITVDKDIWAEADVTPVLIRISGILINSGPE